MIGDILLTKIYEFWYEVWLMETIKKETDCEFYSPP